MISFDSFVPKDGIPIYLQILRHIKRGIASGVIADNDELPSRRVLSALLGVNPNTVQKAYRALEDEGLIDSRLGAKSCMSLSSEKIEEVRRELIESDALSVISAMKQMGLSKEQALSLIENYWDMEDSK